jgi:hypothetical protein
MAGGRIEPSERRCQQPEISIDGAHAPLPVCDRMPAGKRREFVVQLRGGRGVAEERARFTGKAHPEKPFVVAIEHVESAGRDLSEHRSSLDITSDVDQQADERGAVDRIPGEIVDRGAEGRLLFGDPALGAAQQEPLKTSGRHVVARG